MGAIVLVQVDIHDYELYEEYKKLTPATVAAFGGKFLVRGAEVLVLEGEWNHDRLVMLEFPDKDSAMKWYYSKDYEKARMIRSKAAKAKFFILEF
ncbi:MAG: DUF1330 domain-containing protein [Algoriphagus sp.]|uniref:DUF1330 domain-containing protein n=1 Tax=Algoriphagus sp. TaxID=1872435 RepID=UPI00261F7BCC|nr:DUF1330 domain-containing protein [Algoriphagus sp.]MDG1277219.1 DUF1330 domain-containing protein [Algoriphagus sp.]